MPAILKQRQIKNSPARIAFPGWVSLAFPAGAAAARHRGLTNVPFSCITTNLLASLLSRCGPERGAQALVSFWCADDACQTRTEVPAAPFPDSERTPAPSRKFGCSMCDVCCLSPWQRRDATEGGRRGLGRAPPGNTGGFMRARRASLSLHPKQQGGAQRSRLYYGENASAGRTMTSMLKQPHPPRTQQKPAICCEASTRFLWRR